MIFLHQMNSMAEEEKIVEGKDHRIPHFFRHPDEVGRKAEDMLKMNEIRFFFFQSF